jgi:hypothetical protein
MEARIENKNDELDEDGSSGLQKMTLAGTQAASSTGYLPVATPPNGRMGCAETTVAVTTSPTTMNIPTITVEQVTMPHEMTEPSPTIQTVSVCTDNEFKTTPKGAHWPVFIAPVYSGIDVGVYVYSPSEGLNFPKAGTDSLKWPVIQLKGRNGTASLSTKTKRFREELTKIHRGPDSQLITVAEMRNYKLVLHEPEQEQAAKFWVDDALYSIELDSSMMEKRDEMNIVWELREETGVVPKEFAAQPYIAGYVVHVPEDMFVRFFISASGTSRW